MHTNKLIRKYEKACNEVFEKISFYNKQGNLKDQLDGPIKQMDFSRLTMSPLFDDLNIVLFNVSLET